MLSATGVDVSSNFKSYCDAVYAGETLVIFRPQNQNVVMLSEDHYNRLLRSRENTAYLEKLDRSFEELEHGDVVRKSMAELRRMEHE